MRDSDSIVVKVKRDDKQRSWIEEYKVPFAPGKSVLQVLKEINENIDPSLAFYGSCRLGKCGLCRMLINGELRLACTTPVTGGFMAEPDPAAEVVKDLWVVWDRGEDV
jgi:succinate dehydrogenase/fumarate reductase-like Fe-S protein